LLQLPRASGAYRVPALRAGGGEATRANAQETEGALARSQPLQNNWAAIGAQTALAMWGSQQQALAIKGLRKGLRAECAVARNVVLTIGASGPSGLICSKNELHGTFCLAGRVALRPRAACARAGERPQRASGRVLSVGAVRNAWKKRAASLARGGQTVSSRSQCRRLGAGVGAKAEAAAGGRRGKASLRAPSRDSRCRAATHL